jgi:excisionase family DNA binding protein
MILPDNITGFIVSLQDGYFDLKGLAAYSTLAVPTLRDYIRSGKLPAYKVKGKVLVKKSEFDKWLENYRMDKKKNINSIVDGVIKSMKMN